MSGHLVIGAGQVGTAIAAVLKDRYYVQLQDVQPFEWRLSHRPDVLHICFPWTEEFENEVRYYQRTYEAPITVIHSTVPVGTSRRLGAVHSPVTGKHPNLEQSVRTFVKFFGGERAIEASNSFEACGVRTLSIDSSDETEAGKLWQTLQYGWQIAMQKEVYRFCELYGLDPKIVYNVFNTTYNDGYKKLGEPYQLPVLKNMPGPIGGHCVIPNAVLLDAPLAGMLLDFNETYKSACFSGEHDWYYYDLDGRPFDGICTLCGAYKGKPPLPLSR